MGSTRRDPSHEIERNITNLATKMGFCKPSEKNFVGKYTQVYGWCFVGNLWSTSMLRGSLFIWPIRRYVWRLETSEFLQMLVLFAQQSNKNAHYGKVSIEQFKTFKNFMPKTCHVAWSWNSFTRSVWGCQGIVCHSVILLQVWICVLWTYGNKELTTLENYSQTGSSVTAQDSDSDAKAPNLRGHKK